MRTNFGFNELGLAENITTRSEASHKETSISISNKIERYMVCKGLISP
jgi:hypothetical protein